MSTNTTNPTTMITAINGSHPQHTATQQAIRLARVVLSNANRFTTSQQFTMINEIPSDVRTMARLDRLARRHGCFDSLADFCRTDIAYVPTLYCYSARTASDRMELKELANYYDAVMSQLGSSKRIYRV
jgi:hypothetical protein